MHNWSVLCFQPAELGGNLKEALKMKKYANLDCIALSLTFRTSPYLKARQTGLMQAVEEEERPAKPVFSPVLSYSIQPVVQPVPVYSINTPVVVRVGPQVNYKNVLSKKHMDPLSMGKLPILPVFSVYPVYSTHPVFHFPVGIYDHPYSPCFLSKNCGQHE